LIISVPESNAVIFGRGRNDAEIQALKELAANRTRMALQPVTAQIFRWRPSGWELVENTGEPVAQTNPPKPDIKPDTARAQ
jgi:hypothetical protein